MDNQHNAYAITNKLERTRYYMGGYWTFLAKGLETNGQFALIEMNLRKGLEPPAHTHTQEDESFHVIEGEIDFFAGDEVHHLLPGDFIHLPKGVTHSFQLKTNRVKMLAHLVPAGLENLFLELSTPAEQLDYPPAPAGPPDPAWLKKVVALQQQYGIIGMNHSQIKAS